MSEQTPDGAIMDLESALTDLDTAHQALAQFLEDHMQNHTQVEMAYCILRTLDQANGGARAAWNVLWEARPLVAGNRDNPSLKAVRDGGPLS